MWCLSIEFLFFFLQQYFRFSIFQQLYLYITMYYYFMKIPNGILKSMTERLTKKRYNILLLW